MNNPSHDYWWVEYLGRVVIMERFTEYSMLCGEQDVWLYRGARIGGAVVKALRPVERYSNE